MKIRYLGSRRRASITCPGRNIYSFVRGEITEVDPKNIQFLFRSVMHRFEIVEGKEVKVEKKVEKKKVEEKPEKKKRGRKSKKG